MIRMYKTNFKNSCKSNSLYLVHREDPDPLNPRQSSNNLNLQKPSSQSSTTSKTQIKNPSKLERKWDQLSQLTPKLSLLFFNINAQMHHSHITKKTAKKTQKKKLLHVFQNEDFLALLLLTSCKLCILMVFFQESISLFSCKWRCMCPQNMQRTWGQLQKATL